jgi:tetratricopeptide (TPR) repeat protein
LIRRFPEVRVLLEAFAKRSAEVTGTAVRQNRSPDAKQGQGIDNCPERELGSLAAFRPALKETFAAFEARQWDAGFARLNKTLPDFFPARAAELEGFCASRSQTCAPWSSAKDELTKLRRQAFLDFETGRSSAAAEEFARLSAWSPTDPAPAAALAHPEEALALYTDEELGPLATARDSLKSAFAAFAAHEWDEGFRQLEPATKRLADLDDFCAQRARTCGPWLQAKEEIRRINDDGMKAFLAGDRRGAARTFDGVLAWLPAEPSTLVNRAVTADAEGDSALALKLYDAAASLPQTSTLYQAEVLTSRAALLERLGHKALALADLKRADKTAPPDWPRREDTRRQILKLAGPEGSVQ